MMQTFTLSGSNIANAKPYPRPIPSSGRNYSRASVRVRATYATEAPSNAQAPTGKNQLDALKEMSKVVADTGEIDAIKNYKPHDVTTNPSLVLKTVQNPKYQHLLGEALAMDDHSYPAVRPQSNVADILAVNIGAGLLKIIPGRVSTECDAHLSYDTKATIEKGLRIVDLYAKKGVDMSRLYIKIASTWEGIRACEELQKQGIQTNMTLLFSFGQAAACADAGAALISPFVGRIMDWHKAKEGRSFEPHEDPGVLSVRRIYKYYKQYKYPTIVMAASFRNVGEIRELAGCDNITISPALLGELEASTEPLPRKLWPEMGGCDEPKIDMGADSVELFKKLHGEDEMAVQKLAEGIQGFSKDQASLEAMVEKLISS